MTVNQFSNRSERRAACAREGVPMTRGANKPAENVYRGVRRDVYREARAVGKRVRKSLAFARVKEGEIVRRVLAKVGSL